MSQINITNLTFAYEGSYDNIFENVSFMLDTDWRLGFIGRNGRGKTTFLKLLQGKYKYSGKIIKTVEFMYFPFDIPNGQSLTIDIAFEINPSLEQWQLEKELSLLQVEADVLYRPFYTLSNGEQTKLMLAILFLIDNSFLLIDEPTNHLDKTAREVVSDYLKVKKGFILVSHDKKFLDNCVDHILSINKTNIDVEKGNFSSWWKNKTDRDNFEIAQNEKLQRDIKRLTVSARRTGEWSNAVEATKFLGKQSNGLRPNRGAIGHKAAKMMKRAKCTEKRKTQAINDKEKLLKNIETYNPLKITAVESETKRLIGFDNASIFYGDKIVCENVSFDINRGERVALCGKNGSGKTSLIKLICGQDITFSGDFYKANGLTISYVNQDTSFLKGSLSEFADSQNIDETMFKTILRELDFERIQFEKDMADFSAGQKKKVLIAKSLCQQANLYIWDEPLNFIDIFSRIQLSQLLRSYMPTILFVEHDAEFCEAIATKIVQL